MKNVLSMLSPKEIRSAEELLIETLRPYISFDEFAEWQQSLSNSAGSRNLLLSALSDYSYISSSPEQLLQRSKSYTTLPDLPLLPSANPEDNNLSTFLTACQIALKLDSGKTTYILSLLKLVASGTSTISRSKFSQLLFASLGISSSSSPAASKDEVIGLVFDLCKPNDEDEVHILFLYITSAARTALYCAALHRTVMRCLTLHCIVLRYTALYCAALHRTVLRCLTLHCIVLRYTALYCAALHSTV
jgi:hypothetical protein